jgi:hypothetical protein
MCGAIAQAFEDRLKDATGAYRESVNILRALVAHH